MDREQADIVNNVPNATTREAMEEARALPTSDKVQIQPTADQPALTQQGDMGAAFGPADGSGNWNRTASQPTARHHAEIIASAMVAVAPDQYESATGQQTTPQPAVCPRCGYLLVIADLCNKCGWTRAADQQSPLNQCDGCARGLPLENGIHRGEGYDLIGCTADRYTDPKSVARACPTCGEWREDGSDCGVSDKP
jgi:ribosomal protein L32